MRKRIVFSVLLLLVFSGFSETAFAVRMGVDGFCLEGPPCPPASYEKPIQKCQKPAAEYLKDAERFYLEILANHDGRGDLLSERRAVYANQATAAALLYQICSKLEQGKAQTSDIPWGPPIPNPPASPKPNPPQPPHSPR